MDNQSLREKWLHVTTHSAAGILVALLLWFSGLLTGVEGKTYDLRASFFAKPSPASESIVLVVVDQASIDWIAENMGIGWPWPRELFGSIITNCIRRGADSVGFDVFFTENSTYGVHDDIKLKNAMLQAGSFALGSVFPSSESGHFEKWPENISPPQYNIQTDPDTLSQLPSFPHSTFPVPELVTNGIVLSNVQHKADKDGIYRRIHPFVMFDDTLLPALGLGVYLAAYPKTEIGILSGKITVDGQVVPIDKDGNTLLNFRGPRGSYKLISAASVIRTEFQLINEEITRDEIPDDLEGKHVIFGYIAPGLHDLRPSPTDGAFSGVEINATLLDNLLTGDFIKPVSNAQTIFRIIILTCIATYTLSIFSKQRTQIAYAFILTLFPIGIAFFLYRVGYDFKLVPVQTAVVLSTATYIAHRYFIVGKQEKFIRHSFKHYLSPHVIDLLIENPDKLKLGGERKELSLFFSDLEGFTTISEGLGPEELTHLLNEYLTEMTNIILEEQGTVDKYEGDAIIAFWNAPLDINNHAELAVRAALRCQERLSEMRPVFLRKYGKNLNMRIGINTGFAVAGNMGSSNRFDYTVLGDAVNLAARLEGANKNFCTYTMISESTYKQLGDNFFCRELARLRVVGRKEAVKVYEPFSYTNNVFREGFNIFNKGLNYFHEGEFKLAFDEFIKIAEQDKAAKCYAIKCRKFFNSPPVEWEGVWELDAK